MNNENNVQETKEKKGKGFSFNMIVDYVVKFLPIITTAFVALAVISLAYELISGIAGCFTGGGFFGIVRSLFGGVENGIADAMKYVFYAVITASFSKIFNKK